MTKQAILRRQCIRAKRTLILCWPTMYWESQFETSDGREFDELPGTPIYWAQSWEGEADYRHASEELNNLRYYIEIDWGLIAKEDFTRQRHGDHRKRSGGESKQ